MITELEQKNGAIKWKHEIKHGVETLQQHQRWAGVWIKFFKGPFIIYACIDSTMMWWNQRWIVPALFQVSMHASEELEQWWKVSQVSISSLLHITPCAGHSRWSIDCLSHGELPGGRNLSRTERIRNSYLAPKHVFSYPTQAKTAVVCLFGLFDHALSVFWSA